MRKLFSLFFFLILFGILHSQRDSTSRILNTVDCTASTSIRKFNISQPNGSPAAALTWKIVIGKEIEYRARPKEGAINWQWELGSGTGNAFTSKWIMNTTDGSVDYQDKSNNNRKLIINVSQLPINNSDFGDTYGTLRIKNSVYPVNPPSLGLFTTNPINKKVEVFFEKNDTNNPGGVEPNWFYYWSKIPLIQNLLTIPGIPLYDQAENICAFDANPTPVVLSIEYDQNSVYNPPPAFNTYGSNRFSIRGGMITTNINEYNCNTLPAQVVGTDYDHNFSKIIIGEACGFRKGNAAGNNDTGIHVFYRTVVHEREHALIECDVWQYTHPTNPAVLSGFSGAWDVDADGYKDLWETNSPDATPYLFTIGNPALPGYVNDGYNPVYNGCYPLMTCSAGTMYEEDRCRHEETQITITDIDNSDWSFDHLNNIQGKQWK